MGSPLQGVLADVFMAANPSIAVTNEAATNTDGGAWIVYQASVHHFWEKKTPPVVQTSPDGATAWATATDYHFEYAGGVIVFNTARVAGTNNFVRLASGNYYNLTEVDDAHIWTLTLKSGVQDTTPFQATGNAMRNTATLKSGSGKIETVRTDGRLQLELGNTVALQLYLDLAHNVRWDALGIVTGVDPKMDAKGVYEQSMSFDVEGDCYFRAT